MNCCCEQHQNIWCEYWSPASEPPPASKADNASAGKSVSHLPVSVTRSAAAPLDCTLLRGLSTASSTTWRAG